MTTPQPATPVDPHAMVARIMAELEANPEAMRMMLRVLVTNEFEGKPAGLDAAAEEAARLNIRARYHKGSGDSEEHD